MSEASEATEAAIVEIESAQKIALLLAGSAQAGAASELMKDETWRRLLNHLDDASDMLQHLGAHS